MSSLKGHFLLASTLLEDPNFAHSIVLILRHDADGALGIIVNAPLEVSVQEAVGEEIEAAQGCNHPVFRGGPCPGPLMALHTRAEVGGDDVVSGLFVTAKKDELERLMSDETRRVRYVVNYAGWGVEQLESELADGSWLILPATIDDIFSDDADLWDRLSGKASLLRFVRPGDLPDDVSLN